MGVGENTRAIDAAFAQLGDAEVDRQLDHLLEDIFSDAPATDAAPPRFMDTLNRPPASLKSPAAVVLIEQPHERILWHGRRHLACFPEEPPTMAEYTPTQGKYLSSIVAYIDGSPFDGFDEDGEDENEITRAELHSQGIKKFRYWYDFGDD